MRNKINNIRQSEVNSFNESVKLFPNLNNSEVFDICKKYHELRLLNEKRIIHSNLYTKELVELFTKDFQDGMTWNKMEEKYKLSRIGMMRFVKHLPKRHQNKLSDEEVISIYKLLSKGETPIDISRQFKIHKAVVHRIQYGKSYKHLFKNSILTPLDN